LVEKRENDGAQARSKSQTGQNCTIA